MTVNRDVIVAIVLLALSAAFYAATFEIKVTNFGTMLSSVWPRILIVALALLSALYLFRAAGGHMTDDDADARAERPRRSLGEWIAGYRNPILCFVLFFGFLVAMDWIGMLLGGILFVFLALTVMGERSPRNHAIHAAIAIISMGLMWSIFTFGLRVILPAGEFFEGLV